MEEYRRHFLATVNVKNFPDDIYDKLRLLARREHRSISQQIVHMLVKALGQEPELSIMDLRGLGKEVWEGADAVDHVRAERDSWD